MLRRVSVHLGEQRIKIGTLAFDDRKPHASQFCYETAWLMNPEAFAVSPDLPLTAGWHFVNDAGRKSPFPLAFSDTEPDRWGRQVMLRAFRKSGIAGRSLCALDFLLGVDDFARTGALRFALDDEAIEGSGQGRRRTPPLIDLGKIARTTQRFELQQETLEDLNYLEGKGTSLGGARPKCSVIDADGRLALGKFPSVDDSRDISKGEILGLKLAQASGLEAAQGRVVRIDGTSIAVIKRFDRTDDGARIPYWSFDTFLARTQLDWPPVSYGALYALLRTHAAPDKIRELAENLQKRLLLNYLINNADDHGRNTGLLMSNEGLWQLSPAFDINPEPLARPDEHYRSKAFLTDDWGECQGPEDLLQTLPDFELPPAAAAKAWQAVIAAVENWRRIAQHPDVGMTASDIRDYAPAFSPVRLSRAKAALRRLQQS